MATSSNNPMSVATINNVEKLLSETMLGIWQDFIKHLPFLAGGILILLLTALVSSIVISITGRLLNQSKILFTAFMLYMIYAAEGEHKTAHFALLTGFMALGMMIPGMFSGWIQEMLGYQNFFVWILIATIPGFAVAALVDIDPEFGKSSDE